jgi:hypothetical protein
VGTPEVIMNEPDPWELAAFEAEHLAKTGTPKAEILTEINTRQTQVRDLFSIHSAPARVQSASPRQRHHRAAAANRHSPFRADPPESQ